LALDPTIPEKVTNPFDPDRCQGNTNFQGRDIGQCEFKAVPGTSYCKYHAHPIRGANSEEQRNYQLSRYRARVNSFADNPQVKSLREEIGILRLLLETTLNQCADASDLERRSHSISELVLRIEKLVKTCHQLETSTGRLLDRSQLLIVAEKIVTIVATHVKDPNTSERIADAVATLVLTHEPINAIAERA
jgi:hypothetical protein